MVEQYRFDMAKIQKELEEAIAKA